MKRVNVIRLVCFGVAVAAALVYPVRRIMSFEYPSKPPRVYRFKAAAYDPYDPMRGRYVALRLLPDRLPAPAASERGPAAGSMIAVLGTDGAGFATVTELLPSGSRVPKGTDFVRVKNIFISGTWNKNAYGAPYFYRFQLPFQRFYLNEARACDVEKLLSRVLASPEHRVALVVKIYPDGNFMVDNLLVDGKQIR